MDQCQVWIDPVEKLDFQSYASYVEKIGLLDRTRVDDRDHGKGESTPEEVLRTECIEFFNRTNPELPLVAAVTQSAVEEMGLAAGTRVTALVKASVVMLTTVVCRPEARAPRHCGPPGAQAAPKVKRVPVDERSTFSPSTCCAITMKGSPLQCIGISQSGFTSRSASAVCRRYSGG